MSSEIAISLANLGKCYQIYETPRDRLLQMLMQGRKQYYREFWALQDLSLDIRRGEAIGIIGRNGAGKSTLLQMICGTLNSTCGTIGVHGRVAALLELGAGFNPEFNGRENVHLSAAIMGLSEDEIASRYDDIVRFSGIGDFIDQPVKTYSSGMYVRLAFAVATSVDPDILVVDEALSVGDGEFARKSFDRIMGLKEQGTTILFCSHALYQVEAFCDRALWLDQGRCIVQGAAKDVVSRYKTFLHADTLSAAGFSGIALGEGRRPGDDARAAGTKGQGHFTAIEILMDGVEGRRLAGRSNESDLKVRLSYYVDPALPAPVVGVKIDYGNALPLTTVVSRTDQVAMTRDAQGYGAVELSFPQLALRKGEYQLSVYLACENAVHFYDWAMGIASLEIEDSLPEPGLICIPHHWRAIEPKRRGEGRGMSAVTSTTETSGSAGTGRSAREFHWRVDCAQHTDEQPLLELFRKAFKEEMPIAQWRWKYANSDPLGTIVREDDEVVAFYGAMPRGVQLFGQQDTAVQIGDVMVEPSRRRILTRRGPFFLAASTFCEKFVGPGKRYCYAFGFPTERVNRLAEHLGLYGRAGRIFEASWQPLPFKRSLAMRVRPLDEITLPSIDQLWHEMAGDLTDLAVLVRDAAHVKQRYLEHPTVSYLVIHVRQRLSGKPLGVLVLRDHGDKGVELMDLVAPPQRLPMLVEVARRITGRIQRPKLFAWLSQSVADALADSHYALVETEVVIPMFIWQQPQEVMKIRDRWWLMGGDADFR